MLGFDHSLLEMNIETGRKHQIRKHLAEAGYPVAGDRLHGDAKENDELNLQLTACYLTFNLSDDNEAERLLGQQAVGKKEYRLDDEYVVSLSHD